MKPVLNKTANDIYDIIRFCFLNQKHILNPDDWTMGTIRHAKEARDRIKKMHGNKRISIEDNVITIGRHYKITIEKI